MKANIDIESFIQDIRKYAKRLKICLELVKNPVHPRTGKPLSKNTIRQCKTKIRTLKLLIILKERDLIKKHAGESGSASSNALALMVLIIDAFW